MENTSLSKLIYSLQNRHHDAVNKAMKNMTYYALWMLSNLYAHFVRTDGSPDRIAQVQFDETCEIGIQEEKVRVTFDAQINDATITFHIEPIGVYSREYEFRILRNGGIEYESLPTEYSDEFIRNFYKQTQSYYTKQ